MRERFFAAGVRTIWRLTRKSGACIWARGFNCRLATARDLIGRSFHTVTPANSAGETLSEQRRRQRLNTMRATCRVWAFTGSPALGSRGPEGADVGIGRQEAVPRTWASALQNGKGGAVARFVRGAPDDHIAGF